MPTPDVSPKEGIGTSSAPVKLSFPKRRPVLFWSLVILFAAPAPAILAVVALLALLVPSPTVGIGPATQSASTAAPQDSTSRDNAAAQASPAACLTLVDSHPNVRPHPAGPRWVAGDGDFVTRENGVPVPILNGVPSHDNIARFQAEGRNPCSPNYDPNPDRIVEADQWLAATHTLMDSNGATAYPWGRSVSDPELTDWIEKVSLVGCRTYSDFSTTAADIVYYPLPGSPVYDFFAACRPLGGYSPPQWGPGDFVRTTQDPRMISDLVQQPDGSLQRVTFEVTFQYSHWLITNVTLGEIVSGATN